VSPPPSRVTRAAAAPSRPAARFAERASGVRRGVLLTPPDTARFGLLQIDHDSRVLVPRRWTVMQSRWAAELSPTLPDGPILELCSGAGQIGLLAAVLSGRELIQVDADAVACDFATRNARRAGRGELTQVRCADLEDAVHPEERFPLVLADPPYLPSGQLGRYPQDPPTAIDGGVDGLDVLRRCLAVIEWALLPRGAALLQVRGAAQAEELSEELPEGLHLAAVRSADPVRAVMLVQRSEPRQEGDRS
jgi:release factor glutamine methyltransferase